MSSLLPPRQLPPVARAAAASTLLWIGLLPLPPAAALPPGGECISGVLAPGATLSPGQYICSSDPSSMSLYTLNSDGNDGGAPSAPVYQFGLNRFGILNLYESSADGASESVIWSSKARGNYLEYQAEDSHLVLIGDGGRPTWSTGCFGRSAGGMVSVGFPLGGGATDDAAPVVILDEDGDEVWYLKDDGSASGCYPNESGGNRGPTGTTTSSSTTSSYDCPEVCVELYNQEQDSLGTVRPVMTRENIVDFYGYNRENYSFNGDDVVPLMPRKSHVFVHQDTDNCALSYVIVHGSRLGCDGGEVQMYVSGNLENAVVQDSGKSDHYIFDPASDRTQCFWEWSFNRGCFEGPAGQKLGRTDGVAQLWDADDRECIVIEPEFREGVDAWEFVSGSPTVGGPAEEYVDLNRDGALMFCKVECPPSPSNPDGDTELVFIDKDPDDLLGLCRGDCDEDDDCAEGLVCFQRDESEPVPGCEGTANEGADYCIVDPSLPVVVVTNEPRVGDADAEDSNLLPLVYVDRNPNGPLGICQGDCDKDEDCAGDLVCFRRDEYEPIPSCEGTGVKGQDYCTYPPLVTDAPTPAPPDLVFVGEDPVGPLDLCEGDCDEDDDCADGLVCFQRDEFGLDPVPGCSGEGEKGADYCMDQFFMETDAPTPTPPDLVFVGEDPNGPLNLCEGDCDVDDDCADDLVCFQREELKLGRVPGCSGIGTMGADYCIEADDEGVASDHLSVAFPTKMPTVPVAPSMDDTVIEDIISPVTAPEPNGNADNALVLLDDEPDDPLLFCQGDCDKDDDCSGELVCFKRNADNQFQEVPGCVGTGERGADYCTHPSFLGTNAEEETPKMVLDTDTAEEEGLIEDVDTDTANEKKGLTDTAEEKKGLTDTPKEKKGLTDTPKEKKGLTDIPKEKKGLTDTPKEKKGLTDEIWDELWEAFPAALPTKMPTVPAAAPAGGTGLDDASTLPQSDFNIRADNALVFVDPNPTVPLRLCEADCDDDGDCEGDLVCFQRDAFEPVPQCSGTGDLGADYCTLP